MRRIVATLTVLGCIACCSRNDDASRPPTVVVAPSDTRASSATGVEQTAATPTTIREADDAAARRDSARPCKERVSIYEGSIEVDARSYMQTVAVGSNVEDEAIPGLDIVLAKDRRIDFTLDYPFEKPFAGSVTGEITLRRIIDAVRAGFRHMYEGTSQRAIPHMANKDVTGSYGRSFHVIGDLVIESIDLCDGVRLDISIGS